MFATSQPCSALCVRPGHLLLALLSRTETDGERQQRACAVKGGAFQWVRVPPGETLQPEATGAVMEVTKWLKPSEYPVTFR